MLTRERKTLRLSNALRCKVKGEKPLHLVHSRCSRNHHGPTAQHSVLKSLLNPYSSAFFLTFSIFLKDFVSEDQKMQTLRLFRVKKVACDINPTA